jgi:mRNA-degrading endonuclease toxin of MazEF toxin-antitoxin module
MPVPNRGEIWLVDLGYAAKVRPCLVLSIPAADEDRALATLVPHTTSTRGFRFEVALKAPFLAARGVRCAEPGDHSTRETNSQIGNPAMRTIVLS